MKFRICLAIIIIFIASFWRDNWFVLTYENETSQENSDIPTCVNGFHGASYILFTRDIPGGQVINQDDEEIPLDRNSNTAFIAHGFTELTNSTDYFDMVSAWLAYKKMNIFLIQWDDDSCSIGGNSTVQHEYTSYSISYVPRLGDMIARFMKKLVEKYGMKLNKTILVGHSLGGQLVGFTAKAVQKYGLGKCKEIFALDTAGVSPYKNAPCSDRVCITDAHFLVLFHTTAYPGTIEALGNIDYYFNGGLSQPGCGDDSTCSHGRSKKYFTESIRNIGRCMFLGRPFDSRLNKTIDRSQCQFDTCSPAGLQSILYPARGKLYVETSAEPPYCLD